MTDAAYIEAVEKDLKEAFLARADVYAASSKYFAVVGPVGDDGELNKENGEWPRMGEFVFTDVEVGDGETFDTLSGYVDGPLGEAFEDFEGLGFSVVVRTDGPDKRRYIESRKSVLEVTFDHALSDLPSAELDRFKPGWTMAKLKAVGTS